MNSGSVGASDSITKRLCKCIEGEDSEGLHEVLSSVNWSPEEFNKFFEQLPLAPVKHSEDETHKATAGDGKGVCRSALHWAAYRLSHEVMRVLLEFGANPDSVGEKNETPIFGVLRRLSECPCDSCSRRAVRCINVLGDFHADFSVCDKDSWSPLLVAANMQSYECTMALLQNRAPVDIRSHKHGFFRRHNPPSFVSVLSEKLPNLILDIFDRCVSVEGTKGTNDPDFEVGLDLSVILPQGVTEQHKLTSVYSRDLVEGFRDKLHVVNQIFPKSEGTCEANDNGEQDGSEKRWTFLNRFKSCGPESNKGQYRPKREMGHLNDLLESHHLDFKMQRRILRHPLVSVFTDIKWKNLELIYVVFIFLQIGVLIAYTIFLFIVIFVDCPYDVYNEVLRGQKFQVGQKSVNLELISDQLPTPERLCEIQILSKVIASYVLLCVVIVLVKELNHALIDFKAYVKDLLNFVQLGGLASIVLTIIIAWDPNSPIYSWLYPVASFGIGISWCQLFVQVGRFPQLAIYVDMYAKIAVNFCFCLCVYSFILVGFAMSYCILFPVKPEVVDIPLALVRVLTMMTGELDYENLFAAGNKDPENDTTGGTDESGKHGTRHSFHPAAAHVWYVCMVIMVTLVLMNLLVGLAVSDIQRCRKDAETVVMRRRIRYTAYLEKSYYFLTHFLPAFIKDFLRRRIAIIKPDLEEDSCFRSRTVKVEKFKIFIKPNDLKDNVLSKESKESIKNWFMHNRTTKTKQVCKFQTSVGKKRNSKEGSFLKDDAEALLLEESGDTEIKEICSPNFVSSASTSNVQIRRLERRLSDLDHKLDLLIDNIVGRSNSPDD